MKRLICAACDAAFPPSRIRYRFGARAFDPNAMLEGCAVCGLYQGHSAVALITPGEQLQLQALLAVKDEEDEQRR